MHAKTLMGAVALMLMIPAVASAALFSESFTNFYQTDEIVLAISSENDSRDITFEAVDFPGEFNSAAGWSVSYTGPSSLTMSGDTISAGSGIFDVTFNDNVGFWQGILGTLFNGGNSNWAFDFNLQWTEFLSGKEVGQWVYDFDNGINQAPTPVPIPNSAWLLVSGLVLFIGIRRHSSA